MSPAPAHLGTDQLSRPSTPTTQRQKLEAAGPVISSDKWRKAPITAILCRKDNLISADRQEKIWRGMEREWIEAGHAPFVSQPEVLAKMLAGIIQRDQINGEGEGWCGTDGEVVERMGVLGMGWG